MYNKNIRDTLAIFRKMRGLDRHEFASAIEKDYLTVTKWETGRAVPSDEELVAIAEKFAVSPSEFGVNAADAAAIAEKAAKKNAEPAPEAEKKPAAPKPVAPKAEEPKATPKSAAPKAEEPKAAPKPAAPKKEEPKAVPKPAAPKKEEPKPEEVKAEPPVAEPAALSDDALNENSAPEIPMEEYKKAYEEKKARYEREAKLATYKSGSVKIRRMLAWLLDNIMLLAIYVGITVGMTFLAPMICETKNDTLVMISLSAVVLLCVAYPITFILRDLLCGGRSLAKRIFGLAVVNAKTAEKTAVYQRLLRDMFFGGLLLDFIFLIASGRTVGDRMGGTLVVSNRVYKSPVTAPVAENGVPCYDVPVKRKKNHTFSVVVIVIAMLLALVLSVAAMLAVVGFAFGEIKKSEEYEVAYTYLIESDAFAEAEADEEDILLCSAVYDGEFESCSFTFAVDGEFYTVSLKYDEDYGWTVSEKNTKFE